MSPWTYYWLSIAVLAALLFMPVSQLVWVLSVRRLQRKLGQPLSEAERLGQRNRARFIAAILCVIFSAFFNFQILDMAAYGD
jgi:divalent metal cation (Fe/Co/Zn/Cd) transporter